MDIFLDSNLYVDLIKKQIKNLDKWESAHIEIDDRFGMFIQNDGDDKYTGWIYWLNGAMPVFSFENKTINSIVQTGYIEGIFTPFSEGQLYNNFKINDIKDEIAVTNDPVPVSLPVTGVEMTPTVRVEQYGNTTHIEITKSTNEIQKAQTHQYIKRTGVSGNYKYWYKLPNGHIVSGDKDDGPPHVDHDKKFDDDKRHVDSSKKNKDKKNSDPKAKDPDESDETNKYLVMGFMLALDSDESDIDNLLSKLESDHISPEAALDFLYKEADDSIKEKIDSLRKEYGFKTPSKKEKDVKKSEEINMDNLFKSFRFGPTIHEHDTELSFDTKLDEKVQDYFNNKKESISKSTKLENAKENSKLDEINKSQNNKLLNCNKTDLIKMLIIERMFNKDKPDTMF